MENIPKTARKAHKFPMLAGNRLISVAQISDAGCDNFNPFLVYISNVHGLSIHKKCVVVLLLKIAYVASAVLNGVCI